MTTPRDKGEKGDVRYMTGLEEVKPHERISFIVTIVAFEGQVEKVGGDRLFEGFRPAS